MTEKQKTAASAYAATVKSMEMRGVRLLHGLGHEVFATYQTEYGHIIVFIQDSQCPEHLIQRGATCGNIVYYENVLLLDGCACRQIAI